MTKLQFSHYDPCSPLDGTFRGLWGMPACPPASCCRIASVLHLPLHYLWSHFLILAAVLRSFYSVVPLCRERGKKRTNFSGQKLLSRPSYLRARSSSQYNSSLPLRFAMRVELILTRVQAAPPTVIVMGRQKSVTVLG